MFVILRLDRGIQPYGPFRETYYGALRRAQGDNG